MNNRKILALQQPARLSVPVKIKNCPDYNLIYVNWGKSGFANVGEIPIISKIGLLGESPMATNHTDYQKPTIEYDPTICDKIAAPANYFILLHEITHIECHHDNPISPQESINNEQQADNSAILYILENNPHIANEVLPAIYNYLLQNNSNGGETHPPDNLRAVHIKKITEKARKELTGKIRLKNNNSITETEAQGALTAMGFNGFDRVGLTKKMVEAQETGYMSFSSKIENEIEQEMSFDEIATALQKLDTYEKKVSFYRTAPLSFTMDIIWGKTKPADLFE